MVSRRFLALVLAGLAFGLACSKPTKVSVKPTKVELYAVDSSKGLSISVLDQKDREMKNPKIEYRSSAPEVATVDNSGLVTAKSSGEATVTARVGAVSGSAVVVVKAAKEITLGLSESGATGIVGATVPLLVKVINEKGEEVSVEGAVFQSSSPNVAAVDGSGVLTLASTGNTTITATMGKATKELLVNAEIEVPTAVMVETPNQSVAVGESRLLEFTILSNRGRPMKTIAASFTSSQPGVASVDPKGTVTGVSRGTAAISISAGDARNEIKMTVR
jgi:uncharacterized protein YjdB